MSRDALVTGAAGQLGRPACAGLAADGWSRHRVPTAVVAAAGIYLAGDRSLYLTVNIEIAGGAA